MIDAISNMLGSDILLLDLSDISLIADYFIIATAESDRQLGAISEDLRERLKKEWQVPILSIEGVPSSGWVLVDLGNIVVHLFAPSMRARYQLENLWSDARVILRVA